MLQQGCKFHRFFEGDIEAASQKFLSRAAEWSRSMSLAAIHGHSQRCRHFSFIFDRTRLVSFGRNSRKTHPRNLRFSYVNFLMEDISHMVGTHSELNAVLKADLHNFRNMTLVNIRINRNDRMDYSFPCSGCFEMISGLGFKDVFFSTKNEKFARHFF